MNRRTALIGVTIALSPSFAGCFAERDDAPTENEDKGSNSSTPESNDERKENSQLHCSFNVELIENPPKDASVVSAEKEQLLDVTIIKTILDKATHSDENHGTVTRPSGEYEQFSVVPNSTEELEEGRTALEPLPEYHDEDYPSGVYLEYKDIIVAITEQCTT